MTAVFAAIGLAGCFRPGGEYVIADSRSYEASLFRQNCAICHGPEAEGKVLDDGRVVPSLRRGDLKTHTESEIYKQISEGGNGMLPFGKTLTDREIRLLAKFVANDLRSDKVK